MTWVLVAFVLKTISANAVTLGTVVTNLEPSSITVGVSTNIALTATGMANGDHWGFASDCSALSVWTGVPADGAISSFSTSPHTISAISVATAGTYQLCYHSTGVTPVDYVLQSSLTLTVIDATPGTVVTNLEPSSITVGVSTPIKLTGSGVANGDHYGFAADCSTIPADWSGAQDGTISSFSASPHTVNGISVATAADGLHLCYQKAGSIDYTRQGTLTLDVKAATPGTVVTNLEPSSITVGVSTNIEFTATGMANGDHWGFAANCAALSAWPGVPADGAISSFSASPHTVNGISVATAADGLHLCYQKSGSIDYTRQGTLTLDVKAATAQSVVTSFTPVSISEAGQSITFTGVGIHKDDKFAFRKDCATSGVWKSMGPGPTTTERSVLVSYPSAFALAVDTGYKLCYRKNGGSDSVEQTTTGIGTLAITAKKACGTETTVTAITSIAPASITVSSSVEITFTGDSISLMDKFAWAPDSTVCADADWKEMGANPSKSGPLATAAVYKLCYARAGCLTQAKQTGVQLTTIEATSSTAVTNIDPASIVSLVDTEVHLVGATDGDNLGFVEEGSDCSTVAMWFTAVVLTEATEFGFKTGDVEAKIAKAITDEKIDASMLAEGKHQLCFRKKGGSDSVQQTDRFLTVTAPSSPPSSPNTTTAASASVDECFPVRPTITCLLLACACMLISN